MFRILAEEREKRERIAKVREPTASPVSIYVSTSSLKISSDRDVREGRGSICLSYDNALSRSISNSEGRLKRFAPHLKRRPLEAGLSSCYLQAIVIALVVVCRPQAAAKKGNDMQVVLLEKVENLGLLGDVVNVADGYGRNFLLPQKKALRATKENLAVFEARRAKLEADNLKRRQDAERVAAKMKDLCVNIIRQADDSGHLFGSVRNTDIVSTVSDAGFTLSKAQVSIQAPIKTLGIHLVKVVLHPEVSIFIKVNVAQTLEEAEAQLLASNEPVKTANKETSPAEETSEETVSA